MEHKSNLKVAVVGAGQVGATFAYALLIRGLASEIVLIDANRALAEGQAEDMSHGLPYVRPVHIFAGAYSDCRDADIIVITAGAAQKPGETRLELTRRNVDIYRQIIPEITRHTTSAILIVVSNPVDVLTYAAVKLSGLPPQRVIGSGTTLDSARFRYLLSQHCGVDPRNVHAMIIGEHGDSEVPVWSLANISGLRMDDYCAQCGKGCPQLRKDEIFEQVRTAAYHLIEKKGATYH
nr:L-lactate dehydrogenase [bacterium]